MFYRNDQELKISKIMNMVARMLIDYVVAEINTLLSNPTDVIE